MPLGQAAIVREGTDCTIVALAAMVPRAVEAAERLAAEQGIEAEVIDLRTLVPARRGDDPRVGREDQPAVHRRGEPAPVRLGRRDRVARRRRGLLQPRRADRPDHDAARPAAAAAGAGGRGDARPSTGSSTPSSDGSRTRSDGRPHPDGRPRRHRADGLGDGRARWRAAGRRWSLHNRTPGHGRGARGRARRARRSRSPARGGRRRPTSRITMLADDDAVADVYGGADGLLAGARPGSVLVDLSTVPPDDHPGARAAARAPRRGHPRRAGVAAASATAESGQLTLMVGGDGGRPRARPAGPRAAGQGDLPPRAAGHRAPR